MATTDELLQDEIVRNDDSRRVTAADTVPSIITKSLLYPLICVFTLLVCLLAWRETLAGRYFLVAVLAFVAATEILDLAQIQGWQNWRVAASRFISLSVRWMLVVAFVWAVLRIGGLTDGMDRNLLLTWIISTPLALWGGQGLAQYFLVHSKVAQARSLRATRTAVIVGATDSGVRLAQLLQLDWVLRTNVLGYFDDRAAARLPVDGSKVLGRCTDLAAFVGAHGVGVVYVALPMYKCPRVSQLLESLRDSTASIYFVPDLFLFNLVQARLELLRGIPLVAVCETPFFGMRGLAKRVIDIAISSLGITLSAPVLVAVALAIKLTSPGPIIFKQKRYGLDGKPITVFKFRSMTVTEDGHSNYTQVSKNDSRVTAIGAFIRKTSLDELPQLFNVLGGSMSIVGPRPHAVAVNEQYRRLIPGYMVRHKIKPGITGWAQVNGYRGGDDLESMKKRIEFDMSYLNHWSLQFDFRIIRMTALVLLRDKNAY
jgi:putative colanic acid biosynthesis UDP-glucose lipid carrier transferase